jgi:hypothetical protein
MNDIVIPIRVADQLRSKRRSASACLIATAARRTWGGDWQVNHGRAERTSAGGEVMRWRLSAGARVVMWLFDRALPVPVRSVRLTGGTTVPGSSRRPRQGGRRAPRGARPRGPAGHAG